MLIALSKITQDAAGALLIDADYNSKIYDATARVSRLGTLDGGVVIDHQGVVTGDRSIVVRCRLSEADEAIVRALFENETFIHIVTEGGFYTGVIQRIAGDNGDLAISLMIKS